MATIIGLGNCKGCGSGFGAATNTATIEYLLQIFCSSATKKGTWPKGLDAALKKLRKAIHNELSNIVSNPGGMTDAEINGATELLSLTASSGNVAAICATYTKFEIDSVISRNYGSNAEVKKALNEVAKTLSQKPEVVKVQEEKDKPVKDDEKPLPSPPPIVEPAKGKTPWAAILGAGAAAVGAWLMLKD